MGSQLLVVILISTLFASQTASARTWLIEPDGTGEVPTIQAGIALAVDGDTVLIAAGTYSEPPSQTPSSHFNKQPLHQGGFCVRGQCFFDFAYRSLFFLFNIAIRAQRAPEHDGSVE